MKILEILLIIMILLNLYFLLDKYFFNNQEDFATDFEAIANIASLYNNSNMTVSNMTVTQNANINGNINNKGIIFTNGLGNLPNGWGGGLRTFDIYGHGTLGWGDENANLTSYINRGEASFPKLIVAGRNIIGELDAIKTTLNVVKTDPLKCFRKSAYRGNNPDVNNVYGDRALYHLLDYGFDEGRSKSAIDQNCASQY